MANKYHRFFEVLNSGKATKIASPKVASSDAKWIIKEEYRYPCSSYSHSEFFFIDKDENTLAIQLADVEVGKMSVRGIAEDYQLCLEFIDYAGECHTYRLHDDIRYNYPPFIGPKAFTPKYMEWDCQNPVNDLISCLTEMEIHGLESFDKQFKMAAELRELTSQHNRLKRDTEIVSSAAIVVDTIEISEGVEVLRPYAIDAFSFLKKLVLPASMTELEEYSLYTCSLNELYCKAVTPPKMNWFAFGVYNQ